MIHNVPEKPPQRLSTFRQCYEHCVNFPMPAVNWFWCLGACLVAALCLMGLSGLFLAMNYQANIAHAFSSVMTIERRLPGGWLIRALHMGGATMLFAALYLHIGRGLWYGSYKAPRELVWLSGLLLMVLFMVTAFAGYVLPWGQMSYWGATVITNAVGSVPVIGKPLINLLLGGPDLSDIALRRFFVLHFALGFVAVALIALHVLCLHSVGSSNPTLRSRKPDITIRPFHPYYTIKDLVATCVFLILYAILVFFLPQVIGKQANLFPADLFKTPPNISPEWYLAPFFAMLRAIPSQLGGIIVAASSILMLFALPWLDSSSHHNASFRPRVGYAWVLFFASFVILTIAGLQPETSFWVWISRGALVVWFTMILVVIPHASSHERRAGRQK